MCNIFYRFKQKFGTANIKSSVSASGELENLGSLDAGKVGAGSPKHRQKAKSSELLDAIKSEMENDLARHTINEAKLAKLHSILDVLRESGEASDSDPEQQPKRPEFLSVFDTGGTAQLNTRTLPGRQKKKRKEQTLQSSAPYFARGFGRSVIRFRGQLRRRPTGERAQQTIDGVAAV